MTVQDFVYAWKRAANKNTGGSYYYLFDVIEGYSEDSSKSKINVAATDSNELVVTLASRCPYWNELIAFPTFFPVREDIVSNVNWWTSTSTIVTNGPYKMASWEHNSNMVLEKSDSYYGSSSVTPNRIEIMLTDNVEDMADKFKAGELSFIDDVPTNLLDALKANYENEFYVKGQLGTYFLVWNINKDFVGDNFKGNNVERYEANAAIRKAINLLIDRSYIVNDIARAGQVQASSLVAMGVKEPDGGEFYQKANQDAGNSYYGYFDPSKEAQESNLESAVETLKKYFDYDEKSGIFSEIPQVDYLFNASEGHRAIAEAVKAQLAGVGIQLNLKEMEFEDYLAARENGDFTLARYSWISDHSDPIGFLDLWGSSSGYNAARYGRGAFMDLEAYSVDLRGLGIDEDEDKLLVEDGTWEETYDYMIKLAKREKDPGARYALLHKMEDLVMSTGCICPIFYYTDVYMLDEDVKGFYSNPLGYKYLMNAYI